MSIPCIFLGVFFVGCAIYSALSVLAVVMLTIDNRIVLWSGVAYATLMFIGCVVACWGAAYCFGQ